MHWHIQYLAHTGWLKWLRMRTQAAYKNAGKLPGCDIKRRFLFNMSGCSANDARRDMSSGRGLVCVCAGQRSQQQMCFCQTVLACVCALERMFAWHAAAVVSVDCCFYGFQNKFNCKLNYFIYFPMWFSFHILVFLCLVGEKLYLLTRIIVIQFCYSRIWYF